MNLLERVRQRRAELLAELEELDQYLALSELMERKLAGHAEQGGVAYLSASGSRAHFKSDLDGGERNDTNRILRTARLVLRRMKRPMRPAELIPELGNFGVRVYGKNPNNSLSAILSNAKSIFRSTADGWALVEQEHSVESGALDLYPPTAEPPSGAEPAQGMMHSAITEALTHMRIET